MRRRLEDADGHALEYSALTSRLACSTAGDIYVSPAGNGAFIVEANHLNWIDFANGAVTHVSVPTHGALQQVYATYWSPANTHFALVGQVADLQWSVWVVDLAPSPVVRRINVGFNVGECGAECDVAAGNVRWVNESELELHEEGGTRTRTVNVTTSA